MREKTCSTNLYRCIVMHSLINEDHPGECMAKITHGCECEPFTHFSQFLESLNAKDYHINSIYFSSTTLKNNRDFQTSCATGALTTLLDPPSHQFELTNWTYHSFSIHKDESASQLYDEQTNLERQSERFLWIVHSKEKITYSTGRRRIQPKGQKWKNSFHRSLEREDHLLDWSTKNPA